MYFPHSPQLFSENLLFISNILLKIVPNHICNYYIISLLFCNLVKLNNKLSAFFRVEDVQDLVSTLGKIQIILTLLLTVIYCISLTTLILKLSILLS